MTSAMTPKWSKRSTLTDVIAAPPRGSGGLSRSGGESIWFFGFVHLLNVGSLLLAHKFGEKNTC
jgi:hypothetical protein